MSGSGLHPRSASLRSPPFASPKQRADETARSLPGHLRIPSLALLASGKPEKPPPHATILLVRCPSRKCGITIIMGRGRRGVLGVSRPSGRCEDDGVMDVFSRRVKTSLRACGGRKREAPFGRGCKPDPGIEAPKTPSSPAGGRASHPRNTKRTPTTTSTQRT